MSDYKRSPIPWMGNKYKLLKDLIPLFPKECDVFVDLFGGSGVVSMNYKGKQATIYNEFNENIVELIKMIINNNPEELDKYWKDKINEYNIKTMKDSKYFENEDKYQEHLKQQEGYYNLRKDYNISKEKDKRDLYLLTCYSINHLIRFNRNGEFNVSCGNLQEYNDKTYKLPTNEYNNQPIIVIDRELLLDLPVAEDFIIDTGEFKNVELDIAMDIPEGYCVLLFPRSSTFAVHNLIAPVSVIDSDYKKQVHGLLYNPTSKIKRYKAGQVDMILKRIVELLK